MEDEQVEDELPNPELGSPAPAPPDDHAQDIPPRHSTRVRSVPTHLLDYHCYTALATLHEPHTYREASTDPLWQIVMKEELDALSKNHTWDLVTLPPGKSVVSCKWIYKIKTRSDIMLEILEDCIVFLNEKIYISALYRRHKCAVQVKCSTSISVLYK